MNQVGLIGRITKDPDVRYGAESNLAVARFSIAINRGKGKNGEDKGADFPNIVCFGKTAELVEKYVGKGRLVGISGRLTTGHYEKDGRTIYTTEVTADRVDFLDHAKDGEDGEAKPKSEAKPENKQEPIADVPADVPEGFDTLEDSENPIPF